MEIKSCKLVYEDEDVKFETEEDDGLLVLHCEVQGWSASKYKKFIKVFARFLDESKEQGYKGVVSVSPNPRFCELFGAKKLGDFEHYGTVYGVMIWDLRY